MNIKDLASKIIKRCGDEIKGEKVLHPISVRQKRNNVVEKTYYDKFTDTKYKFYINYDEKTVGCFAAYCIDNDYTESKSMLDYIIDGFIHKKKGNMIFTPSIFTEDEDSMSLITTIVSTKCDPEDEFDENVGMNICKRKADREIHSEKMQDIQDIIMNLQNNVKSMKNVKEKMKERFKSITEVRFASE